MSIFFCTFAPDFKMRNYANFTTYRRIRPIDGEGTAVTGQAEDVLAAVQPGVGETGSAESADRAVDIGVYRSYPDDSGEDEHGEPAVTDLYHGSADA